MGTLAGSNASTSSGRTGTHIRPAQCQLVSSAVDSDRLTCTGVDTEWGFEQVIPMFGHFGVDTGIGVLQNDVLHRSFKLPLPGVSSPESSTRVEGLTR